MWELERTNERRGLDGFWPRGLSLYFSMIGQKSSKPRSWLCRKVQVFQYQAPPIWPLWHHLVGSTRSLGAPTHHCCASFLGYDRWAKIRPSQALRLCDPSTPFSHCVGFCSISPPLPPATHPTTTLPSASVCPQSHNYRSSTWAKNRPSQDLCSKDICGSFWGCRFVFPGRRARAPGWGLHGTEYLDDRCCYHYIKVPHDEQVGG